MAKKPVTKKAGAKDRSPRGKTSASGAAASRPARPKLQAADWTALVQALSRIVGPENVHAHDAVCVAYACHIGAPRVVALPRTLDEMKLVADACRRAGVAMDTIWGKQVEKDVLLVDGVVVDTRMLARSNPPSIVWNYTHYGEPPISYHEWGVG